MIVKGSVSSATSVSAEKKEMNRAENADIRSSASRGLLPVRFKRVDAIKASSFQAKVSVSLRRNSSRLIQLISASVAVISS